MTKKSIRSLELKGQRVLARADFNVPLDANKTITDDRRIRQFLPTLKYIVDHGGRAILMSHLGRPKGDPEKDKEFSLKPVAARIGELIGKPCGFVHNCIGPDADAAVGKLKDGEVLLLENLRFHKAETVIDKAEKNPDGELTPEQTRQKDDFAAALAKHGDIYVNDAFGTCHRNHVSMYDVALRIPKGRRVLGFLVEKELKYLGEAVNNPKRPFVAILGGAKVSDKIKVIKNLLPRVDQILIGGAMTYTFWAAQGISVGKSLCETDKIDLARELLKQSGGKIHLPVDSVAGAELKEGVATKVVEGPLPADLMGLDVGPKTLAMYREYVSKAGTIVWNGPVGAFETKPFEKGTFTLAHMIADATAKGCISVIGGGDSAAAAEKCGLADKFTHISTGGGASLTFLEGDKFDTLEILDNA